jgi:hypothetical protein
MPRSSQCLPLRACGARPSEGWTIQGKMALRGEPGDNAKGDFLGGTHSVRPRGEAGRKPRRVMIAGGDRRTEGPGWTCPGEANSLIVGVRSPPLQGGQAQRGSPCGESPGITRRAIFSEGRALRVRKYGPDRNRGMSSRPPGRRRARGQSVATLWFT